MSLAPGSRLGGYEIRGALGAGGMGEVFRAHDSKLRRDVAIKIVTDSFDPERAARFQREAQLLAALNPPNIASIYGLEQDSVVPVASGLSRKEPGAAQDAIQFLVMELVEGDTLAHRLKSGALPVREALAIARQVADALQAAHEKGIIHRDLKPANIALTPDGQVKVLDFGLAKALGPGETGSAIDSPALLTHSPTLSLAATQAGVILGTAAYMAPEQARGKPADKRCDIWAFGCVLYEMLTGTRAFEGEDASETLAFVMAREPDWTRLPDDVPPAIRIVLRRCLEKDRRKRFGDIAAVLVLLDEAPGLTIAALPDAAAIERERSALRQQMDAAVVVARREASRRTRRRMLAATAAAAVAAGAAAGGAAWWTMRPAALHPIRTAVTTTGSAALALIGLDRNLAITPDGSRIVYRGSNQLVVRALDRLEPQPLSGVGAPRGPFISPDGEWVGFFDGNSPLKKVTISGGPPITIADTGGGGPRGATWAPDGTIVFATNSAATGL